MTLQRLYVKVSLVEGAHFTIKEDQSHYLINVLRLKRGSNFRVFNEVDGEWRAQIVDACKRTISAKVISQLRLPLDSIPQIDIWFAPIKKTRTEMIVEKATELGVSLMQPVITQRTQRAQFRVERYKKIVIEAAEQTERLDLPKIEEPRKLIDAIADLPADKRLYYCDEIAATINESEIPSSLETFPFAHLLERDEYTPSIILVGPEGGFSQQERTMLRSRKNTIPVSLGPRVLRAETAVLAALTLWQAKNGDWNNAAH